MAPDNEVTLGELSRGLAAMEGRVNLQFADVNRRLDNLQFVPNVVYTLQVQQLSDRLDELEESKRWMARALVVSLLFPFLVAVVAVSVTR